MESDAENVSNLDFLRALYRDAPAGSRGHVTGFARDPDTIKAGSKEASRLWGGESVPLPLNGECPSLVGNADFNNYCSMGVYTGPRRRKDELAAICAIFIDDLGTKGEATMAPDELPLAPSWLLETAPDNFQGGYFLKDPQSVPVTVRDAVAKALAEQYGDFAVHDLARYLRLPVGTNTKGKYGEPFRHRLHTFEPERRYTVAQIAAAFGIDINARANGKDRTASSGFNGKAGGDLLTRLLTAGADGYPSASEADFALVCELTRRGLEREAIEAIWLRSALARDKLDRADYRRRTILRAAQEVGADAGGDEAAQQADTGYIESVRMADVAPERIDWLWPGRIAVGKLTLVVGDPGLGKSMVTIDVTARVTTGRVWPVDLVPCTPGSVVLISAEDDPADTIRPRLDAAGADVSKVHFLKCVHVASPATGELRESMFSLRRDSERLGRLVAELGDVRLVVVDPISAYLDGTDSHKNADVRALLAPLSAMASEHRIALVGVTHMNKAQSTNALYRTTGSLAFPAAARSAWVVTKDGDDQHRRLFLPLKNNLAPDSSGLAYRVESAEDGQARVVWEPDAVDITAAEAMVVEDEEARTTRQEAMDFLEDELRFGPVEQAKVMKAARAAGISEKTLRRAKSKLGVLSEKASFAGVWRWRLPPRGEAGNGENHSQEAGQEVPF
jgi:hypothetical protein